MRSVGIIFAAAVLICCTPARAADWIELRTPHFTLVSEASEGRTRAWAGEFEIFRRALTQVLPLDTRQADPLTIVLFRSDRRLRPFKPIEHGKPAEMAGYFVRHGGRSFVAISAEGARDDVREIVFHEAVHWHLSAAPREFPLWFEEGVAQVFGNFVLKGSQFTVGVLRPDAMHYVNVSKRIPFAELAAVPMGGLQYGREHHDKTVLFYQESWVFAHALLFGYGGAGLANAAHFVASPAASTDPLQDIEKGLGIPVVGMDGRLAAYLDHGRYAPLTLTFDRSAVEAGFTIAPAPAALVDLTLASLLTQVGRPSEAASYLVRAAAMIDDPRPEELSTLAEMTNGNIASAAPHAREALRRGSTNYWIHFVLARSAIQSASALAFGLPDFSEAAGQLVACVRLNPRFIPALEMLGSLAEFLPADAAAAESVIAIAAKQHPSNVRIQLGSAWLAFRRGDRMRARETLERLQVLDFGGNVEDRRAVARLGQRLAQSDRAPPLLLRSR